MTEERMTGAGRGNERKGKTRWKNVKCDMSGVPRFSVCVGRNVCICAWWTAYVCFPLYFGVCKYIYCLSHCAHMLCVFAVLLCEMHVCDVCACVPSPPHAGPSAVGDNKHIRLQTEAKQAGGLTAAGWGSLVEVRTVLRTFLYTSRAPAHSSLA